MAEPQDAAPAPAQGHGFIGKLRASFEKHKSLYALGIAAAGLLLTYLIWKQGHNASGANTLVTGTSTTDPTGATAPTIPAPTVPGTTALPPGSTGGGGGTASPPGGGGGGGGGGGSGIFGTGGGGGGSFGTGGGTPTLNTATFAAFGGSGAAHPSLPIALPTLFQGLTVAKAAPLKTATLKPLAANVRTAVFAPAHPAVKAVHKAAPRVARWRPAPQPPVHAAVFVPQSQTLANVGSVHAVKSGELPHTLTMMTGRAF